MNLLICSGPAPPFSTDQEDWDVVGMVGGWVGCVL